MRHTSPIKKTLCPHDQDPTYQLAIELYRLVRTIDATDGGGALVSRLRTAALGLSECMGRIAGGVTARQARRLEDAGAEYCRKVSRFLDHLLDAKSVTTELHAKAREMARQLERIFLDGVPQSEPSHPSGAASPIEVATVVWEAPDQESPIVRAPGSWVLRGKVEGDGAVRPTFRTWSSGSS